MGSSTCRLARDFGVPQMRISEVMASKRAITADTGLRLLRCFGLRDGVLTGLLLDHDMALAKVALADAPAGMKPVAVD